MRMGNPAVRKLERYGIQEGAPAATYAGIAVKAIYFAALTILAAIVSFALTRSVLTYQTLLIFAIGCPIAALVCGLVASFVPRAVPVAGTLYVVFEGLAVGFISCLFEELYSGIIFAALLATCCVFAGMTVLYATGVIRVGKMFNRFMLSALVGIMLTQLLLFIVSLFSPALSNMIYGNGALAIIISVVMCLLATFMILADLNNITQIVQNGLDKKYEWVASFGLVTTLIWLYLEFLRLFARIASRKN